MYLEDIIWGQIPLLLSPEAQTLFMNSSSVQLFLYYMYDSIVVYKQKNYIFFSCFWLWMAVGWQGWPSGESTCLPPMWLGFDFRTQRYVWIEFVGSLLCSERFFPGYSGFPSHQKPTFDLTWFDLLNNIL